MLFYFPIVPKSMQIHTQPMDFEVFIVLDMLKTQHIQTFMEIPYFFVPPAESPAVLFGIPNKEFVFL